MPPQPVFQSPSGTLYKGDSFEWLPILPDESAELAFADPPYGVKKAEWDTFASQQAYMEWSERWIKEVARVLKPNGSLYICGYSEILADVKVVASRYFEGCRWLVWHYRNKHNLGKDWGRSHESVLHLRKSHEFIMNLDDVREPYNAHTLRYPMHPQAASSVFSNGGRKAGKNGPMWKPNPLGAKPRDVMIIPAICNGMVESTAHPTQKPEALLEKIILASSNPGNLVIDPFSGSGTTLVVAQRLGRTWMGCEQSSEYCQMAMKRLTTNQLRMMMEKQTPIRSATTHRIRGIAGKER